MSKAMTSSSVLLLLTMVSSVFCQELPVGYNVRSVARAGARECSATQDLRENIKQDIRMLINDSVLPLLVTQNQTQMGNPSTGGYGSCSCGGPGWRRAAYLNMSDPTQTCPPAWALIATPRRSCGKPSNAGAKTCYSATFPTGGTQYSHVCGRIIGYQVGHPEAFVASNINDPQGINGAYVDGVSLTYGSPRQHIWSFAAAIAESTGNYRSQCECTDITDPGISMVPSFVGSDYFCETGVPTGQGYDSSTFHATDPLWDGQGCGPTSTCCTFNNPPWFCKQLLQSTTANLEIRLCSYQAASSENIPIELVEIYTK